MAARRIVKNVGKYITHQADDNEGEGPRRVEKLLKHGSYPGLSSDVLLEAPCFQLRENGEVDRHVFLGVTKTEFVMATQELPDYVKFPNVKYRANIDLDLEGMELVCSSRLESIRFFLTDTSSRKFAVCTSLGNVWYFEMCNTVDGSDEQWTKWREMIAEQDNPLSYGYKTWRVSKEDALDARKTAYPIEIEGEMGSLNFIKRPLNFCAVDNVGVQYSLTSLDSGNAGPDRHTLTSTSETGNCVSLSETDWYFLKSQAVFLPPDFPKLNRNPRYTASQSATDLTKVQEADDTSKEGPEADDRCKESRRIGRSQSECVLGMSSTSFSSTSSLHYKYCVISFIGEALPEESHRSVDIVAIRYPKWNRRTCNQLHKIWNLRNEERLTREREGQLGLSESDESITALFEEFSEAKKLKKPAARWKSAIKTTVEALKPPTLEDLMKKAVFNTCGADKYKDKLWLYGATPTDFAAQMTQIHIDMFKKVTEIDIINFFQKHKQTCHSALLDLLSFSGGSSLLVVKEILMCTKQPQQIQRLKFFMQVCRECFERRDLQSTWSVLTGLQLLPMDRLKITWSIISRKSPTIMSDYIYVSKIFSHMASPQYTITLEKSSQQCPYLVWFDHFLWHMQHALQRTFNDSKSTKTKHVKHSQKKHPHGLSVGGLFGKKASSLDMPKKLIQGVSKHKQVFFGGGSKKSLGCSAFEASQTEDLCTLNSTLSPAILNMADKMSTQIITHALDELCQNNIRARKLEPDNSRRQKAHLSKDKDSGKSVHPKNDEDSGKPAHSNVKAKKPLLLCFCACGNERKSPHTGKDVDTGKPVHPGKGVDTGKPVCPRNDVDTGKPVHTGKHIDSGKPVHNGKGVDTGKPVCPRNDVDTGKPVHTGKHIDSGKPVHTGKGVDTGKPVCPRNDVDTGKPVHTGKHIDSGKPGKEINSAESIQLNVRAVPGDSRSKEDHPSPAMPVIQVSNYTSTPNEVFLPELAETRNSGCYTNTDIPLDNDKKSSHVAQKEEEARGIDRKSNQVAFVSVTTPLDDDKVSESKLPARNTGNSRNLHSQQDGSRSKSLFEAVSEDEEALKLKDAAIDNAVKAQLKQMKKGSAFKIILEEEEEQQQQQQLDVTVQHKPSFLESFFSSNKSSNSSAGLSDESGENVGLISTLSSDNEDWKLLSNRNSFKSSHFGDTNGETASSLQELLDGESDQRRTRSVRFQISPDIYVYEDSVQSSDDDDDDDDDDDTSWSSSSHPWITTTTSHHSGLYLQDTDLNKCDDTLMFGMEIDKNLLEENINWSSSSCLKPSSGQCCVCKCTSCILSNCGLEKLIELQVACLSYHLKSDSKLYAYIRKKSQNLILRDILKTTGGNLQN